MGSLVIKLYSVVTISTDLYPLVFRVGSVNSFIPSKTPSPVSKRPIIIDKLLQDPSNPKSNVVEIGLSNWSSSATSYPIPIFPAAGL